MTPRRARGRCRVLLTLALSALTSATLAAQVEHVHAPAATTTWTWSWDTRIFAGWNYQRRKFRDFQEIESQNWFMGSGERQLLGGPFRVHAMLSLEPFTIQPLGSPQVFQTGETYRQAPLIDYQHPHDLFMGLSMRWMRAIGTSRVFAEAAPVGSPAIGPPAFMHRPSAAENLQAPLSHHNLDATHITPGVVAVGLEWNGFKVEGGAFHGREPDEDRLDLDTSKLDSYGARLSWADGPWQLQVSGADLTTPERLSPYDATRVTASVLYFRGDENRSTAWMAAFGQNREIFGTLEAYLVEITRRFSKHALFMRAENVEKDILDAGFHPIGVAHTHRPSRISALTAGYVRNVVSREWGTFGIGGDVTGYLVAGNLRESYGSPVSFHAFVRYRGRFGAMHVH